MAKNILEKLGIVEKKHDVIHHYSIDNKLPEEETSNELPEVNVSNVSEDNLISDIYRENELADESRSILKIEQIMNTLPSTMTTQAKRNSVIGMLNVFGLTLEELKKDAEVRTDTLVASSLKISDVCNEIINTNKEEIEKAKLIIETCEKVIAEREKSLNDSITTIEAEVKRIKSLSEFLELGGEQ